MDSTSTAPCDSPVPAQTIGEVPTGSAISLSGEARETDSEEPVREAHLRPPPIYDPRFQTQGMPDTEFNRCYPPDAWGQEASPNARVWKLYRDYHIPIDARLLYRWNKTLDVLLIFAGLFSAVSTAFLIESYKALQPDYAQYLAVFLYASATAYNRTGGVFPQPDAIVSPDRFIQTSAVQRWTNGLWFSSLVISLGVALLCILIKQWLDEYDSHTASAAPSPQHWARRHYMYHRGLRKWGVPGLISFLPFLLHLSLFLFLVGIILFLRPLDGTIAYIILVMVSCIAAFYGLSLVMPAWRVECPSYTPLVAQARITLSHAISGLRYVTGLVLRLLRHFRGQIGGERGSLFAAVQHVEEILTVIRAGSRQIHWRDTYAIAAREVELDGYVLGVLLNLPSDINPDIIRTACVAIGAVTAPRTLEIISRNVSDRILHDMIFESHDAINSSRGAPSDITVAGQLHRAYQTMKLPDASHWMGQLGPAYYDALRNLFGIEGLLLQALGIQGADKMTSNLDLLVSWLQSLFAAEQDCSDAFPLRSTCLLFLNYYASSPIEDPRFISCFLLVFSAGRFADDVVYREEYMLALNSVATVLHNQCSLVVPEARSSQFQYIHGVLDGLWLLLIDRERYGVDHLTAQIVAIQTCKCYPGIYAESPTPGLMSGLFAFVRAPNFSRYITTIGCVAHTECLYNYVMLLCTRPDDCGGVDLAEYWECNAILMKICCDFPPGPQGTDVLCAGGRLFPVTATNWECLERYLTHRMPASRDEWHAPALAAYLGGPNAVSTWADPPLAHQNSFWTRDRAELAYHISIVLCRRQRLGLDHAVFVDGFFGGPFLFACFRDLLSTDDDAPEEDDASFEQITRKLATHCLKLAPERCLAICAQLEQIGDADGELRARAVALSQSMRDRAVHGGASPAAECSAECPCTIVSAGTPRGGRTLWERLAGFLRVRVETVAASNV